MLADVEIMFGFLATSVVTYRPLYRYISKGTNSSTYGYPSDPAPVPFYQRPKGSEQHSAGAFVGSESEVPGGFHSTANGITVTDQIELTRHKYVKGSWERIHDG